MQCINVLGQDPNTDKNEICKLVKNHDLNLTNTTKIRKFVAEHSEAFLAKLYVLRVADIKGQSDYNREQKLELVDNFYSKIKGTITDKSAIQKSELDISGHDLLSLGFSGKKIGEFIDNIYKQGLGSPELNHYDKLIKIAARQAVNEMFASDLAIYINDNREITFQKSEGEILDLEEISNEDQEEDLNTNDIGD